MINNTATPALFAMAISKNQWYPADHLLILSNKLVELADGKINRLMVTMPPRHGKSELISKYFPAWYLGHKPDNRIILASYEADFAATWGAKARNILVEHGKELFDIEVSSDSAARNRWDITGHAGGMATAGVGGPITGKGAHVFIIDDPIKNNKDAKSKTQRDHIDEWYKSTAYTRLEPGGSMIIIQTRWNEDDLSGRRLQAMADGGEKWEVLDFPAIAKSDDILGRKVGEALFPRRYPVDVLLHIKQNLGSYWWHALYQQKPTPDGGDIFKRSWFRYFNENENYYTLHTPEGDNLIKKSETWVFQTCDPAATEKETSDYFVLSTWAVTKNNDLLLLEVFREKAETVKHEHIMNTAYQKWNPKFQGVENKTFGLNIIQKCVTLGLPIKPLKADTDKVSRARPLSARYETGSVYHRQNTPWLVDFEDELISFPNGKHDDQVDTASYAYLSIMKPVRKRKPPQTTVSFGGSLPGSRI